MSALQMYANIFADKLQECARDLLSRDQDKTRDAYLRDVAAPKTLAETYGKNH